MPRRATRSQMWAFVKVAEKYRIPLSADVMTAVTCCQGIRNDSRVSTKIDVYGQLVFQVAQYLYFPRILCRVFLHLAATFAAHVERSFEASVVV